MNTRELKWMSIPVALIALVIAACTASGKVSAIGNHAGIKWDLSGSASTGRSGTATNDTSKCYEVKWYDASGQEVGTTTLVPGANHGAIPAGATNYTAVEKPCPPPVGGGTMQSPADVATGGAASSDLQGSLARLTGHPELLVIGGPVLFDDESSIGNAMYEFRIRAASPDEAIVLARQALESPIGSVIDPRIQIISWVRARVAVRDGQIIALARSPFASFEMEWNGNPTFADLSTANNAVPCAIGNGMWAVISEVGASDLNGDGEWNRMTIRHAHADSAGVQILELAMRHDP